MIEFREDGTFLLREQTPLERLVMKAVYAALEQGALVSQPLVADLDGQNVYVLGADDARNLQKDAIDTLLRAAREQAAEQERREADAKKTESRRGRYRTESRPCLRCGQSALVRVVREEISCPACAANSAFCREAGQKSAQLLCEQCGHVFAREFDTSRDQRARYVSTVGRDIDERSRFLERKHDEERKKERDGDGKTWNFPKKMPPPDNGDWEK